MKQVLAMIVKDFTTEAPLVAFLENAGQWGHILDLVLVGWQDSCSEEALIRLSQHCAVEAAALRRPQKLCEALDKLGLAKRHQESLVPSADVYCSGPMPYGLSRNQLLMTAMLAGAYVVGTNAGGLAELIKPPLGTLVPSESPEALATAVEQAVLSERGPLERKKSSQYAAAHFAWDMTAKRVMVLYAQALQIQYSDQLV